ncbi:hypothetical protein E2C01_097099 [Portunus trituberculatus]|uniref:Uncharacterized protein n=1 Tax=Portunus trituberculatus TaxID=210409 RepID=A0A5B7KA99_PORTR|nr:hypothetical protein [Portunus trituberculatus]
MAPDHDGPPDGPMFTTMAPHYRPRRPQFLFYQNSCYSLDTYMLYKRKVQYTGVPICYGF